MMEILGAVYQKDQTYSLFSVVCNNQNALIQSIDAVMANRINSALIGFFYGVKVHIFCTDGNTMSSMVDLQEYTTRVQHLRPSMKR